MSLNNLISQLYSSIALGQKLDVIMPLVKSYNNTYHRGIECSPGEAVNGSVNVKANNSAEGNYSKNFSAEVSHKKFRIDERVLLCRHTNLKENQKKLKGRFTDQGRILEILDKDSYLVKLANDKIVKRRYYDIKSYPLEGGGMLAGNVV